LKEFLTVKEIICDKNSAYFKIYSSAYIKSTDIIQTSEVIMQMNGLATLQFLPMKKLYGME
ncbi:1121_t:CDS:1, partial [Funneliformis geosporum]